MANKTKYKPEYVEEAITLCELGATNAELAEIFGVSLQSLWRWTKKYPAFRYALKIGKDVADDRVERSLFQRAVGYTVQEKKRFFGLEATADKDGSNPREEMALQREQTTEKYFPPDTTACIFWLKNRRPDLWRDRREYTGADGSPLLGDESGNIERARRLVFLLKSVRDEAGPVH
jgi:hypothetical protein